MSEKNLEKEVGKNDDESVLEVSEEVTGEAKTSGISEKETDETKTDEVNSESVNENEVSNIAEQKSDIKESSDNKKDANQKNISKDNKDSKKKDAKKKDVSKKEKKKNRFSLIKYLKETRQELKRVTWPTGKQLLKNSGIVLAVVVVCTLLVWGLDTGLSSLLALILK